MLQQNQQLVHIDPPHRSGSVRPRPELEAHRPGAPDAVFVQVRVFDVRVVLGCVFVGCEPEVHEGVSLEERDRGAVVGEGYSNVAVGAAVVEGRGGEREKFEGGALSGGMRLECRTLLEFSTACVVW